MQSMRCAIMSRVDNRIPFGRMQASRAFLAQYMRMKPCIFPNTAISSCAAFHSSSCVSPFSSSSLRRDSMLQS